MPRNVRTQYTPVYSASVSIGKLRPWTTSDKAIHQEIAKEQVIHWSKAQIAKAEREGYFDRLQAKALQNLKAGLLSRMVEEEEE